MKIINLKSQNFKGIVAIDITPKDNMIVISGKNGAGKTSAMDSVWYTLQWKAGSKGTPMPIRKGEKFAEVTLTLCEDLTKEQIEQGVKPKPLFIVNRKWTTNNNTYLKVTNAEGLIFETPQKLLDGFIGYLSFDPREFLKMSGKEQKELLVKITGYDFARVEEKINFLREGRRLQGQKVKLYEGEREYVDPAKLPEKEISITNLNLDLEKAINHNQGIETVSNEIIEEEKNILNYEERIKNLEEDIRLTKIAVEKAKNKKDTGERFIKENEKIEIETIRDKISKAIETNELIKAHERNKEADLKQKAEQKVYDGFTQEIETNVAELEKGLKESWSKIPDQKLSQTEEGLAYDGTPLSQISYSEQLRIAIRIAMALNPKLRVIFISDYSLLDSESKETVRKMSDDEGYQVWAESVDTGEFGFYIEDGKVKEEIEKHKEEGISDPRD